MLDEGLDNARRYCKTCQIEETSTEISIVYPDGGKILISLEQGVIAVMGLVKQGYADKLFELDKKGRVNSPANREFLKELALAVVTALREDYLARSFQ